MPSAPVGRAYSAVRASPWSGEPFMPYTDRTIPQDLSGLRLRRRPFFPMPADLRPPSRAIQIEPARVAPALSFGKVFHQPGSDAAEEQMRQQEEMIRAYQEYMAQRHPSGKPIPQGWPPR